MTSQMESSSAQVQPSCQRANSPYSQQTSSRLALTSLAPYATRSCAVKARCQARYPAFMTEISNHCGLHIVAISQLTRSLPTCNKVTALLLTHFDITEHSL